MTIRECYEAANSDYNDVLGRLGSESLVKRFALKFLSDTSFQELKEAMDRADGETAFRMAHTLKGVCLNLGFTELGNVSSVLTEALRNTKETKGCEELMEHVNAEYEKLVRVLQELE